MALPQWRVTLPFMDGRCCGAREGGEEPMKAKPRWMKRVIETARDEKTPLPFQRAAKADAQTLQLKKAANA